MWNALIVPTYFSCMLGTAEWSAQQDGSVCMRHVSETHQLPRARSSVTSVVSSADGVVLLQGLVQTRAISFSIHRKGSKTRWDKPPCVCTCICFCATQGASPTASLRTDSQRAELSQCFYCWNLDWAGVLYCTTQPCLLAEQEKKASSGVPMSWPQVSASCTEAVTA